MLISSFFLQNISLLNFSYFLISWRLWFHHRICWMVRWRSRRLICMDRMGSNLNCWLMLRLWRRINDNICIFISRSHLLNRRMTNSFNTEILNLRLSISFDERWCAASFYLLHSWNTFRFHWLIHKLPWISRLLKLLYLLSRWWMPQICSKVCGVGYWKMMSRRVRDRPRDNWQRLLIVGLNHMRVNMNWRWRLLKGSGSWWKVHDNLNELLEFKIYKKFDISITLLLRNNVVLLGSSNFKWHLPHIKVSKTWVAWNKRY